jgi:hypothetical protein
MTKCIIVFLASFSFKFSFSQDLNSQSYFKLNFNIGSGINKPNLYFNSNYRASLDLELKYIKTDNSSFGLRIEQSFLQNENSYRNLGLLKGISGNNFSVYSTYNYTFLKPLKPFRPYLGVGFGINNLRQLESVGFENNVLMKEIKLGGLIRTGFEYKSFNFGILYNLIGKSNYQNNTIGNSFFSISLGTTLKLNKKKDNSIEIITKAERSINNLIIYREGKFLSSFDKVPIYINDSLITIGNGDIVYLNIKKIGKTYIALNSGSKKNTIEVDIQPGFIYFVKCVSSYGFFKNRYFLNMVDSAVAQNEILIKSK